MLYEVITLTRIIRIITRISPKKALELQESGASIVDVRQPSEYHSGHIKGAVNIPLDNISVITSYSIHYTKLYDRSSVVISGNQ